MENEEKKFKEVFGTLRSVAPPERVLKLVLENVTEASPKRFISWYSGAFVAGVFAVILAVFVFKAEKPFDVEAEILAMEVESEEVYELIFAVDSGYYDLK